MLVSVVTILISLSVVCDGFILTPTFGSMGVSKSLDQNKGGRLSHLALKVTKTKGYEGYEENPTFLKPPSKEMTSLDIDITRLCATVSHRLYYADDKKDFEINTKVMKDVVPFEFDDHGYLAGGTSPFAAVVAGKTLILGWRGSASPIDFLNDAALSPQSSIALREYKNIKMQGGFTGIVQNDLVLHEDKLIKLIHEKEIKEIVTTGHSLGGGAAVVAHVTIRGQMDDLSSPWAALKGKIKISTLSFEGPMTVLSIDENKHPADAKLLESIAETTFTTVYMNDIVPRGYGYMGFILDFIKDFMSDVDPADIIEKKFKKSIPKNLRKLPLMNFLESFIDNHIDKRVNTVKEDVVDIGKNAYSKNKEDFQAIEKVVEKFQHLGKVIYYADQKSEPKLLSDTSHYPMGGDTNATSFRNNLFNYKDAKEAVSVDTIKHWHSYIHSGPGLGFGEDAVVKHWF